MNFEQWWHERGSGWRIADGDDCEEHARKVAALAWDEARALGGAQALWDKETAEHEAFRAAHPAP